MLVTIPDGTRASASARGDAGRTCHSRPGPRRAGGRGGAARVLADADRCGVGHKPGGVGIGLPLRCWLEEVQLGLISVCCSELREGLGFVRAASAPPRFRARAVLGPHLLPSG